VKATSRRVFLGTSTVVLVPLLGCSETRVSCSNADISKRAAAERHNVAYEDTSKRADRRCELCLHWVPPESGCGSCKVVPGEIHPQGTCRVFSASS
jgi:hypothetical protein